MVMTAHTPPDRRPRWVLLANGARARLLRRDPDNGALREVDDFVSPRARARAAALDGDRPGRIALGSRSMPLAPHTAPEVRERLHFAHELAQHLEAMAGAGRLAHWALVASSPFLGALRQALGPRAAALLVEHAGGDLTRLAPHLLEPRLRRMLPPGEAPAAGAPTAGP